MCTWRRCKSEEIPVKLHGAMRVRNDKPRAEYWHQEQARGKSERMRTAAADTHDRSEHARRLPPSRTRQVSTECYWQVHDSRCRGRTSPHTRLVIAIHRRRARVRARHRIRAFFLFVVVFALFPLLPITIVIGVRRRGAHAHVRRVRLARPERRRGLGGVRRDGFLGLAHHVACRKLNVHASVSD